MTLHRGVLRGRKSFGGGKDGIRVGGGSNGLVKTLRGLLRLLDPVLNLKS